MTLQANNFLRRDGPVISEAASTVRQRAQQNGSMFEHGITRADLRRTTTDEDVTSRLDTVSIKPSSLRARAAGDQARLSASRLDLSVKLFMIGLVIPWIVPIGSVHLPVYRMVLVLTLLPSMATWLQGKVGGVKAADIGLLLYCIWAGIALAVAQGAGVALQPSASLFIDGMGAYLLARCHIRNAADLSNMVQFMMKLIMCLLPFAVFEWLTGDKLLLTAFGAIFPTVDLTPMDPRMGLWRVQGPFGHPILFGVFCGSMLALTSLVAKSRRGLLVCLVAGATFLSMSSAPIAGAALQVALLCWNRFLHNFPGRWKILWGFAFLGYLIVEFGSNQTPAQFYVSHFTFDSQTGWYRLLIWDYGSASVANNPIFGIGLNDWKRPFWMASTSVDNFWLLTAMRYGLPAFFLLVVSWLSIWIALARKKNLDPALGDYRMAYLICMITFVFVGSTVHFWESAYAWFFFLGGCGVWLLDAKSSHQVAARRGVRAGRLPVRQTIRQRDPSVRKSSQFD